MRNNPPIVITKLVNEYYKDAQAIFWAGSVSKNQGTPASDLDLIIIYDQLPNAYRKAFMYEEWPIDVFVHDTETLRYFLQDSRNNSGISGLIHMILNGKEITTPTIFSQNIKHFAQEILEAGPVTWDKKEIDKERFFITDALEGVLFPVNRAEQIASAAWLYEALAQFYFRAQNKWRASGKSIIRYLENDNQHVAQEFSLAFEKVFQNGDTANLNQLVSSLLAPYGGLYWNGFRLDAPQELRVPEKIIQS